MSLHVGIVCCTAEGTALCYTTITSLAQEKYGAHHHPEITMHTPPLADYMIHLQRGDLEGVAGVMLRSAEKLAQAGADFIICPNNTIHTAFDQMGDRSPIPWMHMAEVVADRVIENGLGNVALLGSRALLQSDVYTGRLEARGIAWERPDEPELTELNRIIMEELILELPPQETVDYVRGLIHELGGRGCDSVLLGCTELPAFISDENSDLPTLDSTRLLAAAAVERAMAV